MPEIVIDFSDEEDEGRGAHLVVSSEVDRPQFDWIRKLYVCSKLKDRSVRSSVEYLREHGERLGGRLPRALGGETHSPVDVGKDFRRAVDEWESVAKECCADLVAHLESLNVAAGKVCADASASLQALQAVRKGHERVCKERAASPDEERRALELVESRYEASKARLKLDFDRELSCVCAVPIFAPEKRIEKASQIADRRIDRMLANATPAQARAADKYLKLREEVVKRYLATQLSDRIPEDSIQE